MATILITGGTGLIGKSLADHLKKRGHQIHILTRNPKRSHEFKWDVSTNYIDENAFKGIDFIIHLAGAGIADTRWTKKRKKQILKSRTASTTLLYQAITTKKIALKGFISASGAGYYGTKNSTKIFNEQAVPGDDFLATVCIAWENAALQFKKAGIKTVIMRTGMVLTQTGGALAKMKTPIILPLGSGKQWISWIHIEDLCALYCKAIEDITFEGIYNAVAPVNLTNKDFLKQLANKAKKLYLPIHIPAFIVKLLLGEMSAIVLTGNKISSKKIENSNYIFTFNNLNKALDNLLKSN